MIEIDKQTHFLQQSISCKNEETQEKSTNKYMYEIIATHEATMRITRRKKQVNFSAICVYCSENSSIQNIIAISLFPDDEENDRERERETCHIHVGNNKILKCHDLQIQGNPLLLCSGKNNEQQPKADETGIFRDM